MSTLPAEPHPGTLQRLLFAFVKHGFVICLSRAEQIGQAAGAVISFPAEALRTSGLELSGVGNVPPGVLPEALEQVWTWVREGKLTMDIEKVPLSCVTEAWQRKTTGERIVIVP